MMDAKKNGFMCEGKPNLFVVGNLGDSIEERRKDKGGFCKREFIANLALQIYHCKFKERNMESNHCKFSIAKC